MRLRGLSEEGENIVGLIPKLQDEFDKFGKGVQIMDNGQLRSTFDIMTDLASVWDTMNTREREYLAQQIAGKENNC